MSSAAYTPLDDTDTDDPKRGQGKLFLNVFFTGFRELSLSEIEFQRFRSCTEQCL